MASVLAISEVKTIRMKMDAKHIQALILFLVEELKQGPPLTEANYLSFLAQVKKILGQYLDGIVDVTGARQLALSIHRYAKNHVAEPTRHLYRMLGHAVATIHVKTHAFGYLYYWFRFLASDRPDLLLTSIQYYYAHLDSF